MQYSNSQAAHHCLTLFLHVHVQLHITFI